MAKAKMRRKSIGEPEYLRRCATSAMIDAMCQTSPAQAAFRDAGREHDELARQLLALNPADEDSGPVSDDLTACSERLMALADLIDWRWGALLNRKASGAT